MNEPQLAILPDPPPPPTPIGLIAGEGRLPVIIAESLRSAGHAVHTLGLAGQADDEATNRPFGSKRAQDAAILGELAARDRFARGRISPPRIAGRNADCLRAEVEPEQRATFR